MTMNETISAGQLLHKKKLKKSTTDGNNNNDGNSNRAHEDTLQALKFPFYEAEREGKNPITLPSLHKTVILQWFTVLAAANYDCCND